MAHLIVNAAGTRTADGTCWSWRSAAARMGWHAQDCPAGDFVVYHVPDVAHGVPAARPIEHAIEGPEGCYGLVLAPAAVAADGPLGREIFSVAVHGTTGTGWADEHGMTIAVSA